MTGFSTDDNFLRCTAGIRELRDALLCIKCNQNALVMERNLIYVYWRMSNVHRIANAKNLNFALKSTARGVHSLLSLLLTHDSPHYLLAVSAPDVTRVTQTWTAGKK